MNDSTQTLQKCIHKHSKEKYRKFLLTDLLTSVCAFVNSKTSESLLKIVLMCLIQIDQITSVQLMLI